jgi:hypothetical protein
MKLNNIIIYAVSGLFAVSLFFFLLATGYSSLNTVTPGELQESLTEFEKKAEEAAQKEEERKKWRNINQVIDQFKKDYLLKIDDFSKFRNKLRATFAKHRLRMTGNKKVRYTYKQMFRDIMRANVAFTVTGAYPDLKRFVHEMNNKTYKDKMVIFRRMQLSKREKEGDIAGEFAVEVYVAR